MFLSQVVNLGDSTPMHFEQKLFLTKMAVDKRKTIKTNTVTSKNIECETFVQPTLQHLQSSRLQPYLSSHKHLQIQQSVKQGANYHDPWLENKTKKPSSVVAFFVWGNPKASLRSYKSETSGRKLKVYIRKKKHSDSVTWQISLLALRDAYPACRYPFAQTSVGVFGLTP